MNLRSKLFIIGFMVFVGWKVFYHPAFPGEANDDLFLYSTHNPSGPMVFRDPCENREYCVYVYLAPWCPHCQDWLSTLAICRNALKPMDRPGLKVIIGDDKKDAINGMAAQVGPPVYLDIDNKFLHALHIHSFPDFIVVDGTQHVVASGEDGNRWVVDKVNAYNDKK